MDTMVLAKILYNMSLDMDYGDNIEHYETEVNTLAQEIEALKENSPCLMAALENIALDNQNMENWLERQINSK